VNENNLKKAYKFLASDELKGRLTGSKEKKAGEYLAKEFKNLGLKPYDGKNFQQSFEYKIS
jgi:hypothetical protein